MDLNNMSLHECMKYLLTKLYQVIHENFNIRRMRLETTLLKLQLSFSLF